MKRSGAPSFVLSSVNCKARQKAVPVSRVSRHCRPSDFPRPVASDCASCLICEHSLVAKLSLWLSQHRFQGVLAEGTFSLVNAEQHLRDKWYHGICQSSATKVSFFIDNMFFDSNVMASYFRDIRPSASLFSLIKFRLGAHSLRVETDRWLRPKPPREQRVCRHCSKRLKMSNISFLTALLTASLEVSTFRYLAQTTNNGTSGSFPNKTPTSLVLLHTTYTCAFKPGCLMSHYWLHTPDCKLKN